MHQLVVEEIAVGGRAVIQGPAPAGDVKLLRHQTLPHLMKHLHQLRIVLLQTQIRHTGIQIIGPDRMADNGFMLL